MDFEYLKQVTKIEYVGPYQIQTTSSPSVNFSAQIDAQEVISILLPGQRELSTEKKQISQE